MVVQLAPPRCKTPVVVDAGHRAALEGADRQVRGADLHRGDDRKHVGGAVAQGQEREPSDALAEALSVALGSL